VPATTLSESRRGSAENQAYTQSREKNGTKFHFYLPPVD
jgi:hypothetical protein